MPADPTLASPEAANARPGDPASLCLPARLAAPDAQDADAPRPEDCASEDWLAFLGHRWNALILWHLADGPLRYSDLGQRLPGISPKVLSERLSGLQARGLIERQETNEFPRRVAYRLSPRALSLAPILRQLYDWALAQGGR